MWFALNNKIDAATIGELKDGYALKDDNYQCLFCNQEFTVGNIYTSKSGMVDAHKAIRLHICEEHGSAFQALIAGDKKHTGLSSVQNELMNYFFQGMPDKKIAEITNTSPSTIRFQRYSLREKAKQAKVFLAIFELMEEKSKGRDIPLIHQGATMVDERYMVTDEETEKIIQNFFASVDPLVLKSFPPKEKKKLVILKCIANQFDPQKKYSEKQVNAILQPIYDDFATIRRYLIEYGFMKRTPDCSEYWLNTND